MLLYCSSAMMMLFPVRRYVTCDWPKLTLLCTYLWSRLGRLLVPVPRAPMRLSRLGTLVIFPE